MDRLTIRRCCDVTREAGNRIGGRKYDKGVSKRQRQTKSGMGGKMELLLSPKTGEVMEGTGMIEIVDAIRTLTIVLALGVLALVIAILSGRKR